MLRYSKISLFFLLLLLLFFLSLFRFKKLSFASPLTWEQSGLDGKFINAIARAPSSDCILYASGPNFVYRTNNCGDTWEFRGYGLPQNDDINSLAVDFSNPDIVFAGAYWNGMYKTTDGGLTWYPSGLNDGQRNIRTVSTANQNGWVYVGTGSVHRSLGGVLVSKNGGLTWAFIGPSLNSIVMKVAIYEAGNDVIWLAGGLTTWKSSNGGVSWEDTGFGEVGAPSLVFDPKNSDIVYAGRWIDGMYKTVDGGIVWSKINTGMGDRNIHNLIIDPTDNKTLYLSTRSAGSLSGNGVYITNDAGSSWKVINNGLPDLNIFPIGLNVGTRKILFAGVPNRGVWRLIFPQTVNSPLLFLPGLGGSWCREKMILNKPCPGWVMTPMNHGYDNFFESLKNAGYIEGKDFYKFPYDWSQDMDVTVGQLRGFINSAVLVDKPPGTKVKLVGHSMGGLVARNYLQKYADDQKVERIVTVGSPHQGAVQFYGAWEGGEIWVTDPMEKLLAELLLRTVGIGYVTPKDAIRDKMPSTLQMFPIFDFLETIVHRIDPPIPIDSMRVKNLWLKNLRDKIDGEQSSLKGSMGILSGTNRSTLEWLTVVSQNRLERILGLWEDGKPTMRKHTNNGDGSALQKSVEINGVTVKTIDGDHGQIIKTPAGITEIFNLLGIASTPSNIAQSPLSNGVLFLIASPARLRITNGQGQRAGFGIAVPEFLADVFDDYQGVFIPNPESQEFTIEVVGQERGEYKLVLAQIKENSVSLQDYFGETASGQIDSYTFPYNSADTNAVVFGENGEMYLEMAEKRLNHLLSSFPNYSDGLKNKTKIESYFMQTLKSINLAKTYLLTSDSGKAKGEIEKSFQALFEGEERFVRGNNQNFRVDAYLFLRSELSQVGWYLRQAHFLVLEGAGVSFDANILKAKISETERLLFGLETFLKISDVIEKTRTAAMIYKNAGEKVEQAKLLLLNDRVNEAALIPFETASMARIGVSLLQR